MAIPMITEASDTQLAGWREAIAAVCVNHSDISTLQNLSLRFIDSEWMQIATQQQWCELELWGLFNGPLAVVKRRMDAMGLVPSLVLGSPVKLEKITSEAAFVRAIRTGSLLRWRRALTGARYARAWWDVF